MSITDANIHGAKLMKKVLAEIHITVLWSRGIAGRERARFHVAHRSPHQGKEKSASLVRVRETLAIGIIVRSHLSWVMNGREREVVVRGLAIEIAQMI